MEDEAHKWDLLLERDQLRLEEGRLRLSRSSQKHLPQAGAMAAPRGLKLTNWATGQLCQRLGIPAAYFRRCPRSLQDAQANHWLHQSSGNGHGTDCDGEVEGSANGKQRALQSQQQQRWLLRANGETVRGILSDRYSKLDNAEVWECLHPVLMQSHFEVNWFAVTDESLHLRLFDPRLSREVLPGDRVMAGLHIGNSEVGKRAVTVDALVYRLVCTNGLVRLVKGKSLLHHRHIGLTKEELGENLGTAIRDALIQGSGFIERLEQSTREPIPDMEGSIEALTADGTLSQKMAHDVKASLSGERPSQRETLFGLVNALTYTAQNLSPDDRYALEVVAGNLLESGPPRVRKSEGHASSVPSQTVTAPLSPLPAAASSTSAASHFAESAPPPWFDL